MREVVRNVALQFPTAIISGRGREKVGAFPCHACALWRMHAVLTGPRMPHLARLSGEPQVERFVQLSELFYAGSHGMDIAGPKVGLPTPKVLPRCMDGARLWVV